MSIISDNILLDVDIINIRFKYLDIYTVLDIEYSNLDRDRFKPFKQIGFEYCRCFPHGGSHQRENLYACFLSQMVMQKDTQRFILVRAREGPTSSGGREFVLFCT